jgi:dipeptidyl aminopeptidase/acylaminoacyl peptidase
VDETTGGPNDWRDRAGVAAKAAAGAANPLERPDGAGESGAMIAKSHPRGPRWRVVLAALLGLVATAGGQGPVAGWTTGRWRVAEPGRDVPSRLLRLEIRPGAPGSEATVAAFEAGPDGGERSWGSARLDLPRTAGEPARAEWAEGSAQVILLIRPEADRRLMVIVRERPRGRSPGGPERVRQVLLEPEDERPVANVPLTLPRPIDPGPGRAGRGDPGLIYVVGLDGAGLRPAVVPDGFARAAHPAWSPDGLRLAFTGFDATGRDPLIRVVPVGGGPSSAVAAGVGPRWSRDGSRIAYMASGRADFATEWNTPGRNDERIEAVDLSGPHAGRAETLARGIWPRFAPTDDRLAFAARVGGSWDIYVRSTDGTTVLRLTDDPATETAPCWTSDGRSIVFLSDRGNRWDLWEVAADGRGAPRRLTNVLRREDEPELSPDGRLVAFTDGLNRRDSQVMILDLGAGTVRPLVEGALGDRNPCWSPDGRSIAFASRRPAPSLPGAPTR